MTEATINFLKFNNPSLGELVFAQVLETIVDFMKNDACARYKVMIGSDSNGHNILDVVTVVAVHRIGNGGRYFWYRQSKKDIYTLRQKIYAEVDASLQFATLFLPAFRAALKRAQKMTEMPFDFQIHVDVGTKGETRDLIHEVTGMVTAYGYEVLVKPESAAATTLADKHVK